MFFSMGAPLNIYSILFLVFDVIAAMEVLIIGSRFEYRTLVNPSSSSIEPTNQILHDKLYNNYKNDATEPLVIYHAT